MDENYWKQLALDWIERQKKNEQNEISANIPEAPKISFSQNDNIRYDNLGVADMEIEDVKDEQPVVNSQIWNNFNNQHPAAFSNIQSHQYVHLPAQQQFPSHTSRFEKHNNDPPRKNFTPLIIPEAPIINTVEDQINTIDMDLNDSDNEEDSNSNSASSVNMMDIQKRNKKLPAWIREGIEKMKREKELEEARIQEELKRKEDEENRKKLMEEALKEIEREKVSKSKYDSSDSEEENEETEQPNLPQTKQKNESNDEEAYEDMMLLVRKTLTSLLLEVTDEKILEISNETVSKYRKKASATTKPALIKLGLAAYSSSTEEDSEDENTGNNSDWEPESVLKERILQKQLTFEKRMKERMEKHQNDLEEEKLKRRGSSSSKSEPEQLKNSLKVLRHSDSDDDKQKRFKNTRKDGEEKYETMIYSISTSSGPIVRVPREKKTRFSDPKDGRSTTQMTHLGMVESSRSSDNNGINVVAPKIVVPTPPILETQTSTSSIDSPKKEKKDKKKRRNSSSSSSSSDSGHRKKHKKHKKSSKHSKKSSKKKDRSRSRSRSRDKVKRQHSIESKSSIRSSESSRRRSRSRSRSRDRHRRRY